MNKLSYEQRVTLASSVWAMGDPFRLARFMCERPPAYQRPSSQDSSGYVSVGRVLRSGLPALGSFTYGGRLLALDLATDRGMS